MMRGSMVAQKINLEDKRVYAPNPMIQEPFFELPVVAAPTMQDTVVSAPIVISHVATMNDDEEHVLQDPIEPVVTHEGEQQQPQAKDVQMWRPRERLKEQEDQLFPMIMKFMILKSFIWRMIPTHMKKP
jgi:hypothetical protein